jgi:uncharacterized protein YtpQ (UPF0354 family)
MSISGHQPPPDVPVLHSETPEHDWSAASGHVFPALRPSGTHGAQLDELTEERLQQEGMKKHALPIVDPGPADLSMVYVLREPAYDVLINAEHLLTWAIDAQTLRDTAMANLAAWSATASWSDELAGDRRLLSSDTGEGGDAARILLPEVRRHLAGECGGPARVLVALPDRDLLIAGSLQPGDDTFAEQFASFAAELYEGAHEPIERGLFELVGEECELAQYAR